MHGTPCRRMLKVLKMYMGSGIDRINPSGTSGETVSVSGCLWSWKQLEVGRAVEGGVG